MLYSSEFLLHNLLESYDGIMMLFCFYFILLFILLLCHLESYDVILALCDLIIAGVTYSFLIYMHAYALYTNHGYVDGYIFCSQSSDMEFSLHAYRHMYFKPQWKASMFFSEGHGSFFRIV